MGPVDDDDRNREAMASAANSAYYDAFESKDFATLSSLWELSDRTVFTHSGWPPIHGTDKILQSYASIFNGPQTLQFILTNELVVADGTLAYVSIDENLVDESGSTSSTSGLNIFSWNDGRWLMVVHHASPIMSR